ncbi:hypothetical protein GO755_20455 [Spirosoma sp. HMF4905]|uniref:Uncharacterized protein n=1 Tax=Spirosoma arboris TaxID=2682092 RepID=A0A7K1SF35_9BACT|nr:hypothetical protein [Spirosoma arboris]MVM32430.1 hypothetical protein [Spirosoma arboris]
MLRWLATHRFFSSGALSPSLERGTLHHQPTRKGDRIMTMQTNPQSKAPTHTVYYLKAREGSDKQQWIKVGIAWEHGDKEGLNLLLNTLGQDNALTVRRNKPKPD